MEVSSLRRIGNGVLCSVFLLLLILAVTTPVWAHAILMESNPKNNSTIKGPDFPIHLRYNVRVDGKRSKLTLIPADGGIAIPVDTPKQTAPDTLESRATGLKPGEYKLQWKALASDGHMSSGEVDFTVN